MITQDDIDAFMTPKPHEKVGDFIRAFSGSLDPRLWIKLIDEEMHELSQEPIGTENHLKELCDLMYVSTGLSLTSPEHIGMLLRETERKAVLKQQEKVSQELDRGLGFYGDDVFMEAFARVHDSNMSKLDSNGNPLFREDGKVMKGPNYKKPNLTDLMSKRNAV